jgi:hypothetical protein
VTRDLPATDALPTPSGEPAVVRRGAARLRRVAAAALATDVVAGDAGAAIEAFWGGAAATAAATEAEALGTRSRAFIEQVVRSCVALERYADRLELATDTIRRLHVRWEAAREEHRRALLAVEAEATLPPTIRAQLVDRLRTGHRAALAGLEAGHAECLAELRRAGAACAGALDTAMAVSFPRACGTSAADVRPDLVGGLAMAEGVVRALEARDRAIAAATEWRRLGPDHSPSEVRAWLQAHSAHAADPLFAQAFVQQSGVEQLLATLTEVGRPGAPVGHEEFHELLGALGTIIVAASAPVLPRTADARTRRQVVLAADAVRQDVVASAGEVFASRAGHVRQTGYWLIGQLVVAAREAGREQPLPLALVRDLAVATAAAEIAETRDTDVERRHGTTQEPRGDQLFASWFDDASTTGDALHQLLAEVTEPDDQRQLLGTVVAQETLQSHRGEELVLAEYLVRRWITYQANGPAVPPPLPLATSADLVRAMEAATNDGSPASAELRARVMVELVRTDAFARVERATARQYEAEHAALEAAAVTWLLGMRESVDATLASAPGERTAYTHATADAHQPRLRVEELTGLVGAFATSPEPSTGGRAPAATYATLLTGELGHLLDTVERGSLARPDLVRIAYFDQAASAALDAVAHQQDDYDERLWRGLAEAKNLLFTSRRDPLGVAESLVTSGTTRTPADDLVISVVRSDVVARQAEANETRTADLAVTLDRILRPAASCPTQPASALLEEGSGLAPDTPTAAEAREARRAEIGEQLKALLADLVPVDGPGPSHAQSGGRR